MSEPNNWPVLARYLSGECSDEEKSEIEAWIGSDPENQKFVQRMKIIWNVPAVESQASDVQKLWSEVAEKAGIAAKPGQQEIPEAAKLVSKAQKWPSIMAADNYRILRYAAMILVLISLGYFFSKTSAFWPWASQTAEWITVSVENGKRDTITLGDGTYIALDAGSTLRYPEKFNGETREIFLDGEGYFEVKSNPKKPFIVHARYAVVTVLGTKFNVRAWQPDQRVTVAVAAGKVSLRRETSGVTDEVVITKGQMSVLPENGSPSEPLLVDVKKHLGWMHNEVLFEDTPLHEILFQLQRWYDVRFELADASVAAERLTLHFENKTLNGCLELIAALTNLRSRRAGDVVYLQSQRLPGNNKTK